MSHLRHCKECGEKIMEKSEEDFRHWLLQSGNPYYFIWQSDGGKKLKDKNHDYEERDYQRADFVILIGDHPQLVMVDVKESELGKHGVFFLPIEEVNKLSTFAGQFKGDLYFALFPTETLEHEGLMYWCHISHLTTKRERLEQLGQIRTGKALRERRIQGSRNMFRWYEPVFVLEPAFMYPTTLKSDFNLEWPKIVEACAKRTAL